MEPKIHPGPAPIRYFFFVAGVAATIAYRITPFLQPNHVKIAWYVGTIGFVLFFWHRTHIETKRAQLVEDYDLINAVEKSSLQGDKKIAVSYLVTTSLTSKTRYNSLFILIASVLALIASLVIDFHLY